MARESAWPVNPHGQCLKSKPVGRFAIRTCKTEILIRTNRASFHPGGEQRAFLGSRTWSGLPVRAGRPGIADQMILTHVMHDLVERAAAVSRGIFDLRADLCERLAFPAHLARREMPARAAWHAGGSEIGRLVADRAAHCRQLITRIAQPATPATLDITLKRREKLISKSMDTSSIMLPDGGE